MKRSRTRENNTTPEGYQPWRVTDRDRRDEGSLVFFRLNATFFLFFLSFFPFSPLFFILRLCVIRARCFRRLFSFSTVSRILFPPTWNASLSLSLSLSRFFLSGHARALVCLSLAAYVLAVYVYSRHERNILRLTFYLLIGTSLGETCDLFAVSRRLLLASPMTVSEDTFLLFFLFFFCPACRMELF